MWAAAAAAKDLKCEKRVKKRSLSRFQIQNSRGAQFKFPRSIFDAFFGNSGVFRLRFTSLFQYCMTCTCAVAALGQTCNSACREWTEFWIRRNFFLFGETTWRF